MADTKTMQEDFWKGDFGTKYSERNKISPEILSKSLSVWTEILRVLPQRPKNILELGSNIGINLHALKTLLPDAALTAVEINPDASAELRNANIAKVVERSILNFDCEKKYDLVLCMGVLIHMNPDVLEDVYRIIDKCSCCSVVMATYYNPVRREVNYRGYNNVLFQGDFAGEFMDLFPHYRLMGYAFRYHRDPIFPGDDGTWFALAK